MFNAKRICIRINHQISGLRDNEIPQHIYRMRVMGYPPGWLLQAEATKTAPSPKGKKSGKKSAKSGKKK